MKIAMALALPLIVTGVVGCDHEPKANNTDGKELYEYYCAGCHKENGEGSFLEGIPANRTTRLTEAQITELILYGKSQMADMPSFELLSEQQAGNIAEYLTHTLKEK